MVSCPEGYRSHARAGDGGVCIPTDAVYKPVDVSLFLAGYLSAAKANDLIINGGYGGSVEYIRIVPEAADSPGHKVDGEAHGARALLTPLIGRALTRQRQRSRRLCRLCARYQ